MFAIYLYNCTHLLLGLGLHSRSCSDYMFRSFSDENWASSTRWSWAVISTVDKYGWVLSCRGVGFIWISL